MKENIINVLMAVNKNYLTQMKTLICSIGDNTDSEVDIYLIHNELDRNDIEDLVYLLQKFCNGILHEIKVSEEFLKGAKVNDHFSVEMYYRIFATELLPKNLNRILWLDADIITIKSLDTLYNADFKGYSIAVCGHREKDESTKLINQRACKRLKLDSDTVYFNSGVLLMDLRKIRENFNKDDTLELIYKMETVLENPDQDILNILYQHDVLLLDKNIYNYQVHYDWEFREEKEKIKNSTMILHYVGPAKPWKPTSYHFTYDYYWKYYLKHGTLKEYRKYKIQLWCYSLVMKIKRMLRVMLKIVANE